MCLELIRQAPRLAAGLLDCVQPDLVPDVGGVRLESGDLSEHAPVSYRADAVVTFGDENPALAVIVEVQLRRDRRKHLSWPAYVAMARARLGCPVILLAVCTRAHVARWARKPIKIGHPGFVLTPLVLGPEELPVYTDGGTEGVMPELLVLSAAVHGAGPDGPKIFAAMLDALRKIESEQARGYIDEVLAVLPDTARCILETLVRTKDGEYKSDFARGYFSEGRSEGKAEGKAEMILAVLGARGILVPDDVRSRLVEATDLEQLEDWGRRAATADSIEDVFG
jgi:hypothetical protein